MAVEPDRGNVLLVADDDRHAERFARWIAEAGEVPVVLAGREARLVGHGDDERVDLVVVRLHPDDPSAAPTIRRLATGDAFPDTPQLHLLGGEDERAALAEWSPELADLALVTPFGRREFKSRVRLGVELGRLRRRIARTSVVDPLTGLYNRRFMTTRLEQEVSRARRHHSPLSLVLFDIDRLRDVNHAHGHDVGDRAIAGVARSLRGQIRREDVLGRCGEECFGVILPGTGFRGAAVFANKARAEAGDPGVVGLDDLRLRLSAGVSTLREHAAVTDADALLRGTENALAEAKRRGGNRTYIDERVLAGERRRIVVADHDASLLALAEDLLELDDYQVHPADSAESVIAALNAQLPDLLIIDLDLADAAGGPRLFETLRERYPEARLPVIAMQSESGGDPGRLQRMGVDRFVTKPFSVSLLRSLARELLESPSSRGRV